MVNQYETVFIATPVLSETQIKEVVGKFKSLIKSNKGELINEEDWGLRKLAYPIQKKSTGFYYLIEYSQNKALVYLRNVIQLNFWGRSQHKRRSLHIGLFPKFHSMEVCFAFWLTLVLQ